jgi:hypothetical protein
MVIVALSEALVFRNNLFKQLEVVNDNLRNDSRHWNTKQERCAELEKEKKNLISEMDALRKDSHARLGSLNVEMNKVRSKLIGTRAKELLSRW